jgi:L-ascorbate metabolism protein UlaG (beta-lactamase superfamily)
MRLTWWGHSSVLLELEGARVVADPVLRPWAAGFLRHVAPPPEAAWLRPDAVVLSHLHHDHCDLRSLRRLDAPVVLAPPAGGAWVRAHGLPAHELTLGEPVPVGLAGTVTAVPAEHSGRREPFGPTVTPVGHLVSGRRTTTWLAGDTALFDGMRDLPAQTPRGVIDMAVVPVWGWGPNLGPGHMDPDEAAQAVAMTGARHAVAVHWGSLHPAGMGRAMRHHLLTPGGRFVEAVSRYSPDTQVHLLGHGQAVAL